MEKKMTRVDAIDLAIECIMGCDRDHTAEGDQALVILRKMRNSFKSRTSKQSGPSKAQLANLALVEDVIAAIVELGGSATGADILKYGVEGIASPQKLTAVIKLAGDRISTVKDKKVNVYSVR